MAPVCGLRSTWSALIPEQLAKSFLRFHGHGVSMREGEKPNRNISKLLNGNL
jgi:hypothetical protein